MALGVRDSRQPPATMGGRRQSPSPAPAPQQIVSAAPTTAGMTAEQAAYQASQNNQKATKGPNGEWVFVPLTGAELYENQQRLAGVAPGQAPPAAPVLPTDPMANRPAAPLTPEQALSQYGASVPAFEGAITGAMGNRLPVAGVTQPGRDPRLGMVDLGGVAPGQAPAAEQGPAEVDRARIDALLGNVSKATSGIMSIGQRDLEFSQAQAQLRQGLDQGQRSNLALARGGSRRDRAANEARAIQSNTELAAQTGQAAAGLRAGEEAAQQQIRLDAYKAAGDLGLNAGALDLNVQQLDMNAATNYLNQLFNRENIQLNIDQQEAERVTNFVRDMALIEKDYYSLSAQERDAVRQDLTRRYGIDQQTQLALTQLDKSDDINWGQLAISGIGGLITGSAQVGAALATKSATGGAA